MLTRRDNSQEENAIQASNFGGLNTTASPVNLPLGDASVLLNIDTDVSGRLAKRKGTRHLITDNVQRPKLSYSLLSNTGLPVFVYVVGRSIVVANIYNDVVTTLATYTNVFRIEVRQANFLVLPGRDLRLLILTSEHPPVQVTIHEYQVVVSSVTSAITFPSSDAFISTGTMSGAFAHINGVLDSTLTVSTTSSPFRVRVTNPGSFVLGDTVSAVKTSWQWWAEAEHWWGDRFYHDVPRVNETGVVQVPGTINSDLRRMSVPPYGISVYGDNPVTSDWSTGRDTYVATDMPFRENAYAFSEGVPAKNTTGQLNPSPDFITYGRQAGEYEIEVLEYDVSSTTGIISIPSHGFTAGEYVSLGFPSGLLYAYIWSITPDTITLSSTFPTYTAITPSLLVGYASMTFTPDATTNLITVANTALYSNLCPVIYKGSPTVGGLSLYGRYYFSIQSATTAYLTFDAAGSLGVDITSAPGGYQQIRRDAGLKIKVIPRDRSIFVRSRKSSLNDNTGALPADMAVTVNNVALSFGASTTAINTWWAFPGSSPFTRSTTDATYYSVPFTPGGTRLGVAASSRVRVINRSRVWLGSSAQSVQFASNDVNTHNGGYVPAYGLGAFANYQTGDFPSCGCLFQERLALGGFRTKPDTVAVSAVADLLVRDEYYNFFQITDDLELTDADPFDILINDDANGRVLALAEWQSFLFVFTSNSVYRVNGSQGMISPTNRTLTYVSSKGAVTANAIAVTENSIYYIADSGLFALPLTQSGDYRAQEISDKIKSAFVNVARANNASWLCYDPSGFKIYMGLDYDNQAAYSLCQKLYVFDIRQEAWTEYANYGLFQTYGASTYYDKALGSLVAFGYFDTCLSGIARFGYRYAIDYAREWPSDSTSVGVNIPLTVFTLNSRQKTYRVGSRMSPYVDVEDLRVWIGSTLQVYGTDWIKVGQDSIQFTVAPLEGATCWTIPYLDRTYYGVALISDGQPMQVANIADTLPALVCSSSLWNQQIAVLGDYDLGLGADDDDTVMLDLGRTPVAGITGYVYPAHLEAFFSTGDMLYKHKRLENVSLWMSSVQSVKSVYVGVTYNSEHSSLQSVEMFGRHPYLVDTNDHVLFRESPQSNGYAHKLVVWSQDPYAWSLDAWQANVKVFRGTGHISGD